MIKSVVANFACSPESVCQNVQLKLKKSCLTRDKNHNEMFEKELPPDPDMQSPMHDITIIMSINVSKIGISHEHYFTSQRFLLEYQTLCYIPACNIFPSYYNLKLSSVPLTPTRFFLETLSNVSGHSLGRDTNAITMVTAYLARWCIPK